MEDMHKRIMTLCEKKGISGYRMCKDIGIRPSTLTELKMGRQKSLTASTAEKVASYFGVSVAYLLGKEEKNPTTETDSGISKAKADFIQKVMQMSDDQLEQLERILDIVESKGK